MFRGNRAGCTVQRVAGCTDPPLRGELWLLLEGSAKVFGTTALTAAVGPYVFDQTSSAPRLANG